MFVYIIVYNNCLSLVRVLKFSIVCLYFVLCTYQHKLLCVCIYSADHCVVYVFILACVIAFCCLFIICIV